MLTRNVKLMIIGTVVGAVLGGTAAWAIAKVQEQRLPPELRTGQEMVLSTNARDYVGLAMALMVVIRDVTDMFRPA
jgi:membrane protein YqaA with SNARE-associated domain